MTHAAMPRGASLHIGKLRNHFMSPHELDDAQIRQWQEAFCEQDPADLVGRVVAEDEWLLIRKLPLKLRWRPEAPASDVGRTWMQGLQQAVVQAADMAVEGDDDAALDHNVLRYRLWRHGLADLLYRSAIGETQRQWAWQRMGLLTHEGMAASEALMQGARVLLQQPDLIWPVLHHCLHAEADTGALTALARRLPASMWRQWWSAAPQTRAWMQALAHELDEATQRAHHQGPAETILPSDAGAHLSRQGADDAPPAQTTASQQLLQWARRQPQSAHALGDALTAWLAALAWPAQGDAAAAQAQLLAARSWWLGDAYSHAQAVGSRASARNTTRGPADAPSSASQLQGHADHAGPASSQAGLHDDAPQTGFAQAASRAVDELPTAPAMPAPGATSSTAWGGALFWLRHLSVPGVVPGLLQAAGMADADQAMAIPMAMQAVAMALQVPIDDPVMAVMTGGLPLQALPAPLVSAAAELVAGWAQWLDTELPDAPAPRMTWVCQRPGRLKIEPGWIELHMAMKQIDTRIRRLALDLDPDWVPLIGAVVRIRYEDTP